MLFRILTKYVSVYNRKCANKFAKNTYATIYKTFIDLDIEVPEMNEIAQTFFQLLSTKLNLLDRKEAPSKEEVIETIEQMQGNDKVSMLGSISLLSVNCFSLIGMEFLARKFGVKDFTFIPKNFNPHYS